MVYHSKIILTVSFAVLSILKLSSQSNQQFDCQAYLEEVIELIEEHSINADSISTNAIDSLISVQLPPRPSRDDCYVVIRSLIHHLGDNHSLFISKDQLEGMSGAV